MLNNLQNTNFGMKIIVTSEYNLFNKIWGLESQGKYVGSPWKMKDANFFNDEALTDGIGPCTAGFLKVKDGDRFFMFHLIPTNPWKEVEDKIVAVYDELKKGKDTMEGFLIGAVDYINNYGNSILQANNLSNLYKNLGIKFTALLGRYGCNSEILHYSLPENKISITLNKKHIPESVEELKSSFSKIIRGDGDGFEFGEKNVQ